MTLTSQSAERRAASVNQLEAPRWFLTRGGALVVSSPQGRHRWAYRCDGCGTRGTARSHAPANRHASRCRGAPDPAAREAAERVQEVIAELRSELPQVDARAAAGIALTSAVLIGTVTAAPLTMPAFAFAAAGAALLTVALLGFVAVLLPSQAGTTPTDMTGQKDLIAARLATRTQSKQRRLAVALWTGTLAVVTLAFGATVELLRGTL